MIRRTLIPLLLVLLAPPTVIVLWHTNVALDGSLWKLWEVCAQNGVFATVYDVWRPVFFGSVDAWKILAIFAGLQLLLMRVMPGKTFRGPTTPQGNVPVYKANGMQAFLLTLGLFYLGAYRLRLFSPGIVYDHFGPMLGALNLFGLLFCVLLYIKGRVAPSSSDLVISRNPILDYYWGRELYPRILGWDVKMFVNCRFGMMGWAVTIVSFAAKQEELYGLSNTMAVSAAIQLIYIARFFWWETGYLGSFDIMRDRAGFYICWGCLVWIPGVYMSPTLYLVNHPNHLSTPLAAALLALGVLCVLITYSADAQRQRVRATNGECTVWGKPPVLIVARYRTEDGISRQNLLLASGWWRIARHFHFVPEFLTAFFWSVPALFDNFLPYIYLSFLTVLLLGRTFRRDRHCAEKYGADWDRYRERVPYRLIPYLF